MAERSNIYNDTAQDVINIRRQLASLLAPPRPTSTPFLDYQQGQNEDQETRRTESELSRKRAMNQVFGQTRPPSLPEFQDAYLKYYNIQPANPGFPMPEFMKEQDPELAKIADENYLRWNLYQQALKDSEIEYRQTWPGFWDRPLISEESMLKHRDNPVYQFLAWLGSDVTNSIPAMEEYKTGYQPGRTVMPWQLTPNEIKAAPETQLAMLGITPAATAPDAILAADAALNAGYGATSIADTYSKRNIMDPEQLWANYLLGGLAVAGGASQAAPVLSRAGSTISKGNPAASATANATRQTAPAGRNGSIAEQMAARFSMAKAPERASGQMDISLLPGETRPTRSLSQFSPDNPEAFDFTPKSEFHRFQPEYKKSFTVLEDLNKLIDDNISNLNSIAMETKAKPLEDWLNNFRNTYDDLTIAREEIDIIRDEWVGNKFQLLSHGELLNNNGVRRFRMSVKDEYGHPGGNGPHANFDLFVKTRSKPKGEWITIHIHY